MNFLILVRHSLPVAVPGEPPATWHLSDEGRQRCLTLAKHLADYDPGLIITSQEVKAIETCEILAQRLGIPCLAADGLHEHVRKPAKSFAKDSFERSVKKFFTYPDELVFGEETANQIYARFYQAVTSLLELYPDERLAIVSHGTVISLFICRENGIPEFEYWSKLSLPAIVVLSLPDFRLVDTIRFGI